MFSHQSSIAVSERSQVGEARREGQRLAEVAGFSDIESGRVSIVVSELATNLARHSQGGRILVRTEGVAGRRSVEILSIDAGPGMGDISACLTDGYSTGGTPGNGLGAVQRMSAVFDLYSSVPGGTVFYSRIDADTADAPPSDSRVPFTWGIVCQPLAGEIACGDTWRLAVEDQGLSLLVADGLGHGPEAAAAADLAGAVFDNAPFAPAPSLMAAANERMRGSRGGAVSIAQIDGKSGTLKYVGVGNIGGNIAAEPDESPKGLFTHNGTVGLQVRKIQEFSYDAPVGALVILYSDGLQSRWSLANYPGLSRRHPAVIAGVLFRDFQRGRDDTTVVVVRRTEGGADS